MTRNYAENLNRGARHTAWRSGPRIALGLFISALLAGLVWLDLQSLVSSETFRSGRLLGLGALSLLLAVALQRLFSALRIVHAWQHRMGFLISCSLPLIFWGVQVISQQATDLLVISDPWLRLATLEIVVSCAGAFMGSLAITTIQEGLWENNSPPAEQVQAQVHQMHVERIGAPMHVVPAKRGFDIFLSFVGLLISSPLWIMCILLLWLEDPGPIFFVKNSVGKGGINFRQLKFRTMVYGAEEQTGPVLSREGDTRVLRFGRFLRKTALDELPQLVNILLGEMSFVGPRPQRTILVHGYLQAMPEYAERHRVAPGLAGLAQVVGHYYITPRQKLRFDRLYIRYLSLGFDLKLLFLAFLTVFWLRWHKNWNGRIPRKWLRFGNNLSRA